MPERRRDLLTVNRSIDGVIPKIDSGIKQKIEHGMRMTEDAVKSRKTVLHDSSAHYEIMHDGIEVGIRDSFAEIFVRSDGLSQTKIEIIEQPEVYNQPAYIADEISSWFPGIKRVRLE